MRSVRLNVVLLTVAGLAGCQSAPGLGRSVDPPMTSTSARSPARPAIREDRVQQVSGEQPTRTGHAEQLDDTTSRPVLSMTESLSFGLAQNPDLIALRENELVGRAALAVAQTYPWNPFVQAQATPLQDRPEGDRGDVAHYVLLMQQLELAGQQDCREAAGEAALNAIRWNILNAELQTVGQTLRLYFAVLYQRGLRDLARQADENNQHLLQTVERQLAAGQASGADAAIVKYDARATAQQARLSEATYRTAVRDLQRHLGLAPQGDLEVVGDLRTLRFQLPGETESMSRTLVIDRAVSRPDVLAARADADAARAALGLASARKTPDLQIGPYYQHDDDTTTSFGLRAQMDLPVINSGRPLEIQRCAELRQRLAVATRLQQRAHLEAEAAFERFVHALDALPATAPDKALPMTLARLEEQFRAGEIEILRIVQSRQSLLQSDRAALDLLNEAAQAAANLTSSTGVPIEAMVHEP